MKRLQITSFVRTNGELPRRRFCVSSKGVCFFRRGKSLTAAVACDMAGNEIRMRYGVTYPKFARNTAEPRHSERRWS